MQKIQQYLVLLVLFVSVNLGAVKILAESSTENEATFSITPLSVDTGQAQSTYYDLFVSPGEKKQIKVRIYNTSSNDIEITTEINDASTNDNGITSYQKVEERDSSLVIGFSDFTKIANETIIVPGKSSVDAVFTLDIPEQPFEGMVLGGLRFTSTELTADSSKSQTAVKNQIAYTVAVLLRESNQTYSPELSLNKVVAEQRNYRNYISANIQNSAPTIIKELEIKAQVYKKGTNELLYEASNDNMRMAPNSNFLFGINLENQPFKNGEYTMKVTGTADGEPLELERDFTISKPEAKKWNQNAIFVESKIQDNTWLYLGLGVLTLLLISVIFYVGYEKKKGTDQQ